MPEPWVSASEVASHVGVAKDSVYRRIEAKRLAAHRVGRLWKLWPSELDEWAHAGWDGLDESDLDDDPAARVDGQPARTPATRIRSMRF